eukprot:TRINITY_DN11591_c0_g1_i2.p1 TRINITY_DN11591_c0_g1~~TRINITY_DN11591_c0_g1_i2.p1  ORF type:complete len:172 (+),score=23.24 TRINITY_DN11591_c0_g1_i2:707-1222(+)
MQKHQAGALKQVTKRESRDRHVKARTERKLEECTQQVEQLRQQRDRQQQKNIQTHRRMIKTALADFFQQAESVHVQCAQICRVGKTLVESLDNNHLVPYTHGPTNRQLINDLKQRLDHQRMQQVSSLAQGPTVTLAEFQDNVASHGHHDHEAPPSYEQATIESDSRRYSHA